MEVMGNSKKMTEKKELGLKEDRKERMKEQKESCVNERAEHPESGSTKRRISKKGGKVELRVFTDRFKSQRNKNEERTLTKMQGMSLDFKHYIDFEDLRKHGRSEKPTQHNEPNAYVVGLSRATDPANLKILKEM